MACLSQILLSNIHNQNATKIITRCDTDQRKKKRKRKTRKTESNKLKIRIIVGYDII